MVTLGACYKETQWLLTISRPQWGLWESTICISKHHKARKIYFIYFCTFVNIILKIEYILSEEFRNFFFFKEARMQHKAIKFFAAKLRKSARGLKLTQFDQRMIRRLRNLFILTRQRINLSNVTMLYFHTMSLRISMHLLSCWPPADVENSYTKKSANVLTWATKALAPILSNTLQDKEWELNSLLIWLTLFVNRLETDRGCQLTCSQSDLCDLFPGASSRADKGTEEGSLAQRTG